jgi:hypothetical protein
MTNVREPKPDPQARAVEIVADAIRILKSRDGIDVPEALILERARNVVTGLEGAFDLIPAADGERRAGGRLRSFGSPPPMLAPGSRFAAAMAEYLTLRAEFDEADRELGESMERLESTAPAAGSVG